MARARLALIHFVALPLLLVVPLLVAVPCGIVAAEALPSDIAQQLSAAVARGDDDASRHAGNERRQRANPWLEAAVIAAIAERPDLAGPIVGEAVRLSPRSRETLIAGVTDRFPAFAEPIRRNVDGTSASARPVPASEQAVRAAPRPDGSQAVAFRPVPGYPPPEERPAGWPILPREGGADGYDDPLEGLNRVFFYVNGALDFLLFEPLARTYGFIMPDPVKPPLHRAFRNLSLPVVFANDLLQLEFQRAGTTLGRFAINSTFGLAGMFDVADSLGLEPHRADFGQTLHSYGVGDGFYLVLPFFGPTTVRDAVGLGVDSAIDPRGYLLDTTIRFGLAIGEGIVRREQLIGPVDFLSEEAVDHYIAVRAWTYQQRERELSGGCTEPIYVICPPKR